MKRIFWMKIKSPSRKEIQMLKNVGGFMGLWVLEPKLQFKIWNKNLEITIVLWLLHFVHKMYKNSIFNSHSCILGIVFKRYHDSHQEDNLQNVEWAWARLGFCLIPSCSFEFERNWKNYCSCLIWSSSVKKFLFMLKITEMTGMVW